MNERVVDIYLTAIDPAIQPGLPGRMRVRLRNGQTRLESIPSLDAFRAMIERPEVEWVDFLP